MFAANEVVMYGHYGLCQIRAIEEMKFGNADKTLYYVLQPVRDTHTTFYAPVGSNKIDIRRMLAKDEIYSLTREMPDDIGVWVKNDQQRREAYKEMIKSGNRREIIKMIKGLYDKQEEKRQQGKKLQAFDDRAMKEAEKLLYEEFAYVLNIPEDAVVPFILEQLERCVPAE